MTPQSLKLAIESYWKRKKNEWERTEYQAWLTGYFTTYSIGVNFSKKVKYPKNPLENKTEIKEVDEMDTKELTKVHEDYMKKLDLLAKVAMGNKGK